MEQKQINTTTERDKLVRKTPRPKLKLLQENQMENQTDVYKKLPTAISLYELTLENMAEKVNDR